MFVGLIALYQKWISPLFGPSCRFIPSCSAYGIEAVTKHGPWRGGWLTLKRLKQRQRQLQSLLKIELRK